jgi:steroid 5-alpha reductase family enzyme
MTRSPRAEASRSAGAVLAVVLVGAGLALAGSDHGARVGGVPVYALAVAVAFVIQWAVFVPSYLRQTERFFDLTGSLTFITVTIGILVVGSPGVGGWVLGAMVVIWAGRLGTFLVSRIRRYGRDDRFDALKPRFLSFLGVWTLQGLWVSFTAGAAWIAMTSSRASTMLRRSALSGAWSLTCTPGAEDVLAEERAACLR